MNTEKNKNDYLYKGLTEKIIGFSFDIYKQIGARHPEKIYQKALENKLIDNNLLKLTKKESGRLS